ncbi:MAG: ROK family protein [Pirellulales bacterium]
MFLGIEIGGTKLQLGVGRGHGGPLVELARRDIDARRGAEGILKQIQEAGAELLSRHVVTRIGIGFGGPVNSATGRVLKSHQVAGWDDAPLAEWCQTTLGVPAVLANDCDAAALAEARFGAGRGARTVFYVTVGTGIGGGLVIDGQVHGVGRPAVAEIGHLRPGLHADRPEDTIESMASGPGIAATAQALLSGQVSRSLPKIRKQLGHPDRAHVRERLERVAAGSQTHHDDLLRRCGADLESLNARHVAQAASEGNELAREVLDEACQALGWAIAQVVTLVAPEIVVVGGGVSLMSESLFMAPVRRHALKYVFPPLAHAYEILPAQLGEEVVVHGALAIAAAAA